MLELNALGPGDHVRRERGVFHVAGRTGGRLQGLGGNGSVLGHVELLRGTKCSPLRVERWGARPRRASGGTRLGTMPPVRRWE
ncbi:hypothetical protein STIAU_0679 [Stigmatella aurantiaca DW4/3-1]|uniref:Uncharacterized protein n=1 Tax=Stigmatella aurantiaca (strain DW4/3-1) TaxID=378806 RepID=Q08RN2_STIAD|nr:hypothetical protein STIAU_0679 [Stigmatella aurantiaca DW4/3-1]